MRLLRSKPSRVASVSILVVVSFVLGTSLVSASAENTTANILACINKNTGSVRISKLCSPRETPFEWLINGLTGKQGPRGSQILSGLTVKELETKTIGEVGDYFLSLSDATLYGPKTSSGWPLVGIKLQGPIGPRGEKGDTGAQGIQGAAGVSTSYSSTIIRSVYDSNGALVGELLGASGRGVTVKIGASIVSYEAGEGTLQGSSEQIFLDSSCSGTVYSPADFANQYSTTFPYFPGINWVYDTNGGKIYDPYAIFFVGKNVGAVLSVTSFYYSEYTGVNGAGGFECLHSTRTLRNALKIQAVSPFTPSFPRTISTPISIR